MFSSLSSKCFIFEERWRSLTVFTLWSLNDHFNDIFLFLLHLWTYRTTLFNTESIGLGVGEFFITYIGSSRTHALHSPCISSSNYYASYYYININIHVHLTKIRFHHLSYSCCCGSLCMLMNIFLQKFFCRLTRLAVVTWDRIILQFNCG